MFADEYEEYQYICSDPYAKFSRWPTGRPIGQRVDHLANRLTYWAIGKFGIPVNPLPKQLTKRSTNLPSYEIPPDYYASSIR